MTLNRLKAATAAALFAAAVIVPSAMAPAAQASGCTDYRRQTIMDITTGQLGYIGYVEMLYSPTCKQIQGHFHVDSTFRANHSGWDVGVQQKWYTYGSPEVEGGVSNTWTLQYNSSSQDFWSYVNSIYGQPSENFSVAAIWTYNSCQLVADTPVWNFSNGRQMEAGTLHVEAGYTC